MLKPGHSDTTDCQMASAGQRCGFASVFKFASTNVCANEAAARQAVFFWVTFDALDTFVSVLAFVTGFCIWLGILGVAGRRLGANKVLRQLALPHQQGYSALSLGV